MDLPRDVHDDEQHADAIAEYNEVVEGYAEARKLIFSEDPEKQKEGIGRLDDLHNRNLVAQSKLK